MPQDTVQQAIVREAVGRIRQQLGPNGASSDPFADRSLTLSNQEIAEILDVLDAFISVPAGP